MTFGHIYTYAYAHARTHIRTHTRTHACTHTYTHARTRTRTCTPIRAYTHTRTRVHAHTRTCTYKMVTTAKDRRIYLRTKKRDRADEKQGVTISQLVPSIISSRRYTDFPELRYPGKSLFLRSSVDRTQKYLSELNKQAKHTHFYNFADRINFSEHWKLVNESSEFHFTLSRAHRAHFSNSKYAKKAAHLK